MVTKWRNRPSLTPSLSGRGYAARVSKKKIRNQTVSADVLFDSPPEPVSDLIRTERRHRQQEVWLASVGPLGWAGACEAAGCEQITICRWIRLYPEFRDAARSLGPEIADRLERIVDAIASGEIEATPTQMAALAFRLKGLRPEVYSDRSRVTLDATARVVSAGDGGRARILLDAWRVVDAAAGSKKYLAPQAPNAEAAAGSKKYLTAVPMLDASEGDAPDLQPTTTSDDDDAAPPTGTPAPAPAHPPNSRAPGT